MIGKNCAEDSKNESRSGVVAECNHTRSLIVSKLTGTVKLCDILRTNRISTQES